MKKILLCSFLLLCMGLGVTGFSSPSFAQAADKDKAIVLPKPGEEVFDYERCKTVYDAYLKYLKGIVHFDRERKENEAVFAKVNELNSKFTVACQYKVAPHKPYECVDRSDGKKICTGTDPAGPKVADYTCKRIQKSTTTDVLVYECEKTKCDLQTDQTYCGLKPYEGPTVCKERAGGNIRCHGEAYPSENNLSCKKKADGKGRWFWNCRKMRAVGVPEPSPPTCRVDEQGQTRCTGGIDPAQ